MNVSLQLDFGLWYRDIHDGNMKARIEIWMAEDGWIPSGGIRIDEK